MFCIQFLKKRSIVVSIKEHRCYCTKHLDLFVYYPRKDVKFEIKPKKLRKVKRAHLAVFTHSVLLFKYSKETSILKSVKQVSYGYAAMFFRSRVLADVLR